MKTNTQEINRTIRPGYAFHLYPESLAVVNHAVNAGYVIRVSHTQAQWVDGGIALSLAADRDEAERLLQIFTEKRNAFAAACKPGVYSNNARMYGIWDHKARAKEVEIREINNQIFDLV